MVEHCLATSWEEKPARTPPLANRNGKRTATQKDPATRKGNSLQNPAAVAIERRSVLMEPSLSPHRDTN